MASLLAHVMSLLTVHAYLVLFCWVLLEQAGLPIPSVPVMLAVGTMSSAHHLHMAFALPLAVVACLISDTGWYMLGRRYGARVLETLCRFSFEAATCVERTQRSVATRGSITLLFAKFVPGLSQMSAPIAGQAGMSLQRFWLFDLLGSLGWAAAWLLAGRFFGDLVKRFGLLFHLIVHNALWIVLAMVVGWLMWSYGKRRAFLAELRGLRLEPAQLLAMFDDARAAGLPQPFVVDLRHALDVRSDPEVLPGAVRIGPSELKQRRREIPRDRDVVVYCTCPSEETSARVAMDLRKIGITRVRPLRGGLQGWRDAGYPLEMVETAVAA